MDLRDFKMIPEKFHTRLWSECEGRLFFRPSPNDPKEGAAYFLNGKRAMHKTKNDNGVKYSGAYVQHYVFAYLIIDLHNTIKSRPKTCCVSTNALELLPQRGLSTVEQCHIFDINLEDRGGYNWEIQYSNNIDAKSIFEYIRNTTPKEPSPKEMLFRYELKGSYYHTTHLIFNFRNKETVSALAIANPF